jgi:hypothetical protein
VKVKAAVYREHQVGPSVFGFHVNRTSREMLEGELDEDGVKTLKQMLERGRDKRQRT